MNPEELTNSVSFKMTGTARNLLIVNISGFVLGAVIIYILLLIRMIFSPVILAVGILAIGIYMLIDYRKWQKNGVQMIEIDDAGINIYRGSRMVLTRIDKKQITGINIFKKMKRTIVNILTGGNADSSLPGFTLFSGPRVRITDDAFDEKEFAEFITKLNELKPELNLKTK